MTIGLRLNIQDFQVPAERLKRAQRFSADQTGTLWGQYSL